jgi:hypothetical protein
MVPHLASNQFIALAVFIVVIGGLLSSHGYTIYNIFFKQIDWSRKKKH